MAIFIILSMIVAFSFGNQIQEIDTKTSDQSDAGIFKLPVTNLRCLIDSNDHQILIFLF